MSPKADLSRHERTATPHTPHPSPVTATAADLSPPLTQTSIGPQSDTILGLQQTVGNRIVGRLLAGSSRPTTVQRASPKVSMPGLGSGGTGKDSGGDGNGEKERNPDQFVGLEHVKPARQAEERYRAYFEENRARILNVLNSPIAQYNANPLMGATLLQLFREINQQRAARIQAYQNEIENAYDALAPDASEEAERSNDMALEVLGQEGQALRNLDHVAEQFLDELIEFLQPYQDFVTQHPGNPMNQPVGGSLFPPIQFAPYNPDHTVAQALQAQRQIDALTIITNLRKDKGLPPPPPPGGDPQGRKHF